MLSPRRLVHGFGPVLAVAGLLVGGCATAEADTASASGAETAEKLAVALRGYVYAGYDVAGPKPTEAALATLREARAALTAEIARAGLGPVGEEDTLDRIVPELRAYFQASSDLAFLPLGPPGSGIALVRVAEQREVPDRRLVDRGIAYRVITWTETVIQDHVRYRAGPAAAPVARSAGRTIYLDLAAARQTARDRVIARLPRAAALAERLARNDALTPAEIKDLLRYRALVTHAAEGGEAAVGAAIARAEELRLAALFAAAGEQDPAAITEAEALASTAEVAILLAAATGDPRYQLATAIALTLAAPESPTATGATRALRAVAGGADLTALLGLAPDAMRARAQAAIPPG